MDSLNSKLKSSNCEIKDEKFLSNLNKLNQEYQSFTTKYEKHLGGKLEKGKLSILHMHLFCSRAFVYYFLCL